MVVGVSCSVVGPKRYERWGVDHTMHARFKPFYYVKPPPVDDIAPEMESAFFSWGLVYFRTSCSDLEDLDVQFSGPRHVCR